MSATINSSTHIDSIIRFINHLDHQENYYYAFTGRTQKWDQEDAPDTALASYDDLKDVKNSLIYMKKIATKNCVSGLRRYNWQDGNVYSPWQSDKDMLLQMKFVHPDEPYYAFVDDYSSGILSRSVFLCLDNNNGVASTVQPSGNLSSSFETGDGYIWKFMYNIDNSLYQYVTDTVIPYPLNEDQKTLEHLNVETNTQEGTIEYIRIDDPGSGYVNGDVIIAGDGVNATASFTVDGEGKIIDVNVTSAGSGYNEASVSIDNIGSDAILTPMISPKYGHGYDSAEQLNVSYVIARVSFIADETGLFPTQNTYRRIGIIKNPRSKIDSLLTGDKYNFFDELQMINISEQFPLSQTIQGNTSGATARLFYQDPASGSTASFYVIDRKGDFQIDEDVFYVDDPAITATIDDINLNDNDRYSGDIIYYENVQFIARKAGQTERFIIPIEF